ncbi:MAG: biotin/lipoyl-containing protein, partial [Clostridia bacterium]|nr:biotin/lipoyl-containing protein [Clostridia bacterium]
APAPAPAPAPAAPPAGAETVSAPMPGNIVAVKVSVGQSVNAGDVLCVLEAMKMENEIMAPKAGKVVAVSTSAGATVNTGDPLVSLG